MADQGPQIEFFEVNAERLAHSLRIFGSAHRYYQGPGAFDKLGDICHAIAAKPAIIIDADVFALLGERLAATFGARAYIPLPFAGEVTVPAIEAMLARVRAEGADIIVGVGGGKALDAAKGVALRAGLSFVTVPTVASNDSPVSMGLALYDDPDRLPPGMEPGLEAQYRFRSPMFVFSNAAHACITIAPEAQLWRRRRAA